MRARGLVGALAAIVVLALAIAKTVSATTTPRADQVHALGAAARVGATPGSTKLDLLLPMKDDSAGLRRFALAVSTPGSAQYGQYESIATLARQFGAPSASIERTVTYLKHAGASGLKVDATGLFIDATLPAVTAERIFGTTLAQFRTRQDTFTAPTSSPSIPRALQGMVTGVVGLDTRPVASAPTLARATAAARKALPPRPTVATGPAPAIGRAAAAPAQPSSAYQPATGVQSGCPAGTAIGAFTPNQYLSAYNFSGLQAAGLRGQGERVALIEIDGYYQSDIAAFAKCFGLHVPPIKLFGVGGLKHALVPGGESTLDIEVLDAAAPDLKQIDVYEGSADERSSLKALTAPLQNPGFKPDVISASLGLCEPDAYASAHRAGIQNSEDALAMSAASGISFLDSSGDTGSTDCQNPTTGEIYKPLAVNYPTSSWYVTGVGGTNLRLDANNQIQSQVVWNDTTQQPGSAGGGGSSVLIPRPPYQAGTVTSKFRSVPDVSMLADIAPGFAIYCTAKGSAADACINASNSNPWLPVGGTSAATPLLAGGFALIDEALRHAKRQDLGLANPLIYAAGRNPAQASSVFSDVTQYSNDVGPYVGNPPVGCCNAGVGYDQASGWGSINLANFNAFALAQVPAIVHITQSVPRQRPIRAKRIETRVSCSGSCLIGAYATIHIGRAKPFIIYSSLYSLKRTGEKTVEIKFTRKVLTKLHTGAAAHRRLTATVVAAITDPAGNIERKTSSTTLQLRG